MVPESNRASHTKLYFNEFVSNVLRDNILKMPFTPSYQGMTYYVKFIILKKDCLVMKKIGNWPITEADTNFSKISTKNN